MYSLKSGKLSFRIYDSIDTITSTWKGENEKNVFFSPEFMHFIEKSPPLDYTLKYIVFEQEKDFVGIALLQITHLKLADSINYKNPKNRYQKTLNSVKTRLANFVSMETLICGNALLTGEYGFHFKDDRYSFLEQLEIVEEALAKSVPILKSDGINIDLILMKDFYSNNATSFLNVENTEFTEFCIEPNMILKMRDWNSFDDYLADLKSKSRVRAKRAFKMLGNIEKRELTEHDVTKYNKDIYQLYIDTAEEAGFNLFYLPENYFIELQKSLKDKVKIVGYFIGDELISYYTIVISNDHMEAHYLGYNKAYNAKHQLYLNMLYDLIREGIECKTENIQFSRTALEIKSSIGAIPFEMACYLKHTIPWKNRLLKYAICWFAPDDLEWTPRSPFKLKG